MSNDLAKLITAATTTASFTQDPRALHYAAMEIEKRTGISRRSFLGGLVGTAAAVAAGSMLPPGLLVLPGRIAIPAPVAAAPMAHVMDAVPYSLNDMKLVTRYLGKRNFGSMWEPHGTTLNAFGTPSDEEFSEFLFRATVNAKHGFDGWK